jgi:phosphoribosylformylglycinamidine cyclo-ligase
MSEGSDGAPGYAGAGVADQRAALTSVARRLGPTLELSAGRVLIAFGHYASVIELRPDLAIALCTDGVGTKTMVAAMLDRYDTIGFDCVAMNVNDLLCVGARPVALVDYLGVNTLDERRADEVLAGLARAARAAGIAIPGGEIAQLPEIVGSHGDARAFDLVGTSVGTLHPREVISGARVAPGDALIGIASSGIHSNGLTLARRVLLERGGHALEEHVASLGRSVGEELLEPTLVYVRAATALWDAGIETLGLAHITGDGLVNLLRIGTGVGYVVTDLPEPPPIFGLIQRTGAIGDEEMFRVFNMGIGFVAIVSDEQAGAAIEHIVGAGYGATRIGRVTERRGCVQVDAAGIELYAH